TAPVFMAWNDMGMSPWPVMNMIGIRMFALASSAWKSRPLSPGNLTSSTRQLVTSGSLLLNNSAAEPNVPTLRLTDRNRLLSASVWNCYLLLARSVVRRQSRDRAASSPARECRGADRIRRRRDESLREALRSLCRSVSLRVETFRSAADLLRSKLPDVASCLVLDVRLPGVSGLDFQAELAKANIHIPIIFMTGHGDIPMSVQAMKAGAVDFLTKPFRDQDMLDAVAAAIERDRSRRKDEQRL